MITEHGLRLLPFDLIDFDEQFSLCVEKFDSDYFASQAEPLIVGYEGFEIVDKRTKATIFQLNFQFAWRVVVVAVFYIEMLDRIAGAEVPLARLPIKFRSYKELQAASVISDFMK